MANVKILVLLVAAALLPHSIEGAEHVVDWIIPPQGPNLYTSFAANTIFTLNDTLVFNFTTGAHNVATLSKKHYESCNVSEVMQLFDTAPARITLNRTRDLYFACTFPSHCTLGQKLAIHVTAASTSSSLPPPPAHASASSPVPVPLPVTLPLLLMAVAIV